MMDIVLIKRYMLKYVNEMKIMRVINLGNSDNSTVLHKVKLVSTCKKGGRRLSGLEEL